MAQFFLMMGFVSCESYKRSIEIGVGKIGSKREDAGRTRFLPAFIMKKLFVEQLTDICFLFKMQETDTNKFFFVPLLHLTIIV